LRLKQHGFHCLWKRTIIIERTTPTGSRTIPSPGKIEFQREIARMKVYEEMADIHKALYVKKSTLKRSERDTVEAQELQREEIRY